MSSAGGDEDHAEHELIIKDARVMALWRASGHDAATTGLVEEHLVAAVLPMLEAAIRSGAIFQYVARLHPTLQRLFAPPDWTAEDRREVAEDAFLSALATFRARELAGEGWQADCGRTLRAELFSICVTKFPNAFRGWRGRGRGEPPAEPDGGPATMIDPARIVVGREELSVVIEGIRRLEPHKREALTMSVNGVPQADIARRVGSSLKTVQRWLRESRRQLKALTEGERS